MHLRLERFRQRIKAWQQKLRETEANPDCSGWEQTRAEYTREVLEDALNIFEQEIGEDQDA